MKKKNKERIPNPAMEADQLTDVSALCDLFDKADVSRDGTISIQGPSHHSNRNTNLILLRKVLP